MTASSARAEAFARAALSMPDAIAVGFLEAWHADTCECGQPEDGMNLLTSIRRHWAGRL